MLRAIGVGLLLSACAGPPDPAIEATTPDSEAFAKPVEVQVTLNRAPRSASELVEHVAARCWLDAELQGDALLVDRLNKRFVIVGKTDKLVVANLSPISDNRTRVTLQGAAIEDSAKANRLAFHLQRADDTGETAC